MRFQLFIFLVTIGVSVNAQHNHEDHEGHHHSHHKNEIGVANAPVYFVKEKELTYGLHLHYIRTLGETKFGIGLGYEQIFDEHEHKTFGIVASYRVFEGMSVTASPGVTSEKGGELFFALHLETVYEWEVGNFHIGPVVEVAYDPEDYHFSIGLHVGYGF